MVRKITLLRYIDTLQLFRSGAAFLPIRHRSHRVGDHRGQSQHQGDDKGDLDERKPSTAISSAFLECSGGLEVHSGMIVRPDAPPFLR